MKATPVNAVLAEREAICAFLEHKGQRINAERIRRGEHHRPHAAVAGPGEVHDGR